jgi:hypothetical protein
LKRDESIGSGASSRQCVTPGTQLLIDLSSFLRISRSIVGRVLGETRDLRAKATCA